MTVFLIAALNIKPMHHPGKEVYRKIKIKPDTKSMKSGIQLFTSRKKAIEGMKRIAMKRIKLINARENKHYTKIDVDIRIEGDNHYRIDIACYEPRKKMPRVVYMDPYLLIPYRV